MIAAGEPVGAPTPYHRADSNPGTVSPTVGISGINSRRVADVTAMARSVPALMYWIADGMVQNTICTCPLSRSVSAGAVAAIRHVRHLDAGHQLEQFARGMVRPARAAGPHVDLARIGLRVGDEFADVLGRKRRIDRHEVGKASDARDRRNVAHEIEAEIFDHFARNTSPRGNRSNTEASCEKLVARMSLGLPAIHCDRSMVW